MIIRVPLLLQRSLLVISPLDRVATRAFDPPGEPSVGYDDDFRETWIYGDGHEDRASARQEGVEIKVPCQVEYITEDRLRMLGFGDAPISQFLFVLHRKDLESLGLLDAERRPVIKKGDRVDRIERIDMPGVITRKFEPPLYVYEVRPGSFGFGPDGYDLEFLICWDRSLAEREEILRPAKRV